MWERQRDPKHAYVATTKMPLDQRPAGTEGLCWAVAVNASDVAAGVKATTPCRYQAHHLGRHSWQPLPHG